MNYDRILKIAAKGDLEQIQNLLQENNSLLNRPSEGHNRTLLWEAVNSNRIDLVKYLVEQGADVNIPGRYRSQTFVLLKPYCIAHKKKKETLKNYLLSNGHVMDIFSIAYLKGREDLLNKLANRKYLINQRQEEDKIWKVTPIHFAVSSNNLDTILPLLELGATIKEHSKLLYEIACRNNRLDIIQLLTKYGGNPTLVDVPPVFHHNNQEIITYFINQGLNCDKLFGMDWPPIVYVCRGDKGEHPDKVSTLSKYIKNINATTLIGVSAMHAASKAGYLKVIKILLAAGGDINSRDKKGKTPLQYARKYKREIVEHFLIKNGGIE